MGKFISESENLASLVSKMGVNNAQEYKSYGHLRIEAAFDDRVFIVYQPRGPRPGRPLTDQKEPTVLSTVRVTGLSTDIRNGATARLYDEASGAEMTVGYVPKKLFNYPIFIALPSDMSLKLGGQKREDNSIHHSFTFAFLLKTRNRSDFYSTSNIYVETPEKFLKLFPDLSGKFTF